MTINIGSQVQIISIAAKEAIGKQGTIKSILAYPDGKVIGYKVLIGSDTYFAKHDQVVELA